MQKITIYTLDYCPYCKKAKTILRDMNFQFEEIDATQNEDKISKELKEKYDIKGEITYPQIIIGKNRIGGCSDLQQLIEHHQLDTLLKED